MCSPLFICSWCALYPKDQFDPLEGWTIKPCQHTMYHKTAIICCDFVAMRTFGPNTKVRDGNANDRHLNLDWSTDRCSSMRPNTASIWPWIGRSWHLTQFILIRLTTIAGSVYLTYHFIDGSNMNRWYLILHLNELLTIFRKQNNFDFNWENGSDIFVAVRVDKTCRSFLPWILLGEQIGE